MHGDSVVFHTHGWVSDENYHNCPESQDWSDSYWQLEVNCFSARLLRDRGFS